MQGRRFFARVIDFYVKGYDIFVKGYDKIIKGINAPYFVTVTLKFKPDILCLFKHLDRS